MVAEVKKAHEEKEIREVNGLVATISQDSVVIHLENHLERGLRGNVAAELEKVLAQTPAECGWVVDLSELKELSLTLVNVLSAFQHALRSKGQGFRLVGACPELFPQPHVKRLSQWLDPGLGSPAEERLEEGRPHPEP